MNVLTKIKVNRCVWLDVQRDFPKHCLMTQYLLLAHLVLSKTHVAFLKNVTFSFVIKKNADQNGLFC